MAIPGFNEPFPSRDAIVKPSRKATETLVRWQEQSLQERVDRTPFRVEVEAELTVDASTSGNLGGDQVAGLYRIVAYREVTTADPVSSSLALVIGWTHNGKALTRTLSAFAGAPQTINDTAGDVAVIETDAGTPISYTITYASNTPGLAQFVVTLVAELVNAQG